MFVVEKDTIRRQAIQALLQAGRYSVRASDAVRREDWSSAGFWYGLSHIAMNRAEILLHDTKGRTF